MDLRRQPSPRRSRQRLDDPFDRRLDQWLETGRQLVDGVAGTRPGRRPAMGRGGRSAGTSLDAVGRWVGDKIDWLLDEEEDDWGGSWQEARPERSSARPLPAPVPAPRDLAPVAKRPLDAISRRQPPLISSSRDPELPPLAASAAPADDEDWPNDDSFRLDRWQRSSGASSPRLQPPAPSPRAAGSAAVAGRRPLPRSSRRRA